MQNSEYLKQWQEAQLKMVEKKKEIKELKEKLEKKEVVEVVEQKEEELNYDYGMIRSPRIRMEL